MAFEIRGIHHADDDVWFGFAGELAAERVERDFFVRRVCAERITAGQVEDVQLATVRRKRFPGFYFHGDPGIVADALVSAG